MECPTVCHPTHATTLLLSSPLPSPIPHPQSSIHSQRCPSLQLLGLVGLNLYCSERRIEVRQALVGLAFSLGCEEGEGMEGTGGGGRGSKVAVQVGAGRP